MMDRREREGGKRKGASMEVGGEEKGVSFCCGCAEREGRGRGGAFVLQSERGRCMAVFVSLSLVQLESGKRE